ncbi:RNA polymerase sigma-70 factor (ECF subfamily) [Hamadaea flava]|uniref:RNA polymerase subunit sigma-70 n=1 Tax=Hamadaea flava TaxID=1742688 RepID=A0ABV8LSM0_9ACTN|nr:RNA polymerase subunit sigma-70 [Hamadaea flava]MCP2328680.1 RNA polymerase sigma-70 factor (ECF subfamily) [Hamadaea flava]
MPDFETRAEPHRRELLVHCYRMLGSMPEAEDAVQETFLRAWRAWARYDERTASVRTWLYKIATNTCLTSLEGRARRPLPAGIGAPADDPRAPLVPALDVPWLQPFPDARLDDPAGQVVRRGTLRLALVAALQLLPARQRAVLVLRDVLDFSADETARLLDTSPAAVNSALQRARAGLSAAGPVADEMAEPADDVRKTVDRYVEAFEAADVDRLVELLSADVVLEMPPVPLWYRGAADYGRFMARVYDLRGRVWRTASVGANTQPAVAAYCADDEGVLRLHTLQVFTVQDGRIAHTYVFQHPEVFTAFNLPPVLAG